MELFKKYTADELASILDDECSLLNIDTVKNNGQTKFTPLKNDVLILWEDLKEKSKNYKWYEEWLTCCIAGFINCARANGLIGKEEHKLLIKYKEYLK